MKIFRKIRQILISEGKVKRYLLYAIGEILLVMIGILLAFSVSNWNENQVKRNTELRHYKNVRDQIIGDKKAIAEKMEHNDRLLNQFVYGSQIIETNDQSLIDTLGRIAIKLTDYSDFDRKGNIYETFVNSGEIKILNNQKIVAGLRRLEEKYIYINRMENIHFEALLQYAVPLTTSAIRHSSGNVEKPDLLYSYQFQNIIILFLGVMKEKDEIYHEAIDRIDIIIALIDVELKSKID
ncbi:MAG: hypothetical protein ACI8VT_001423 [Saprospiraceae bacterium]|jgi:hypothetical protein